MIDNKILKHKFLFFFLVFVFSMMLNKFDVHAEENYYLKYGHQLNSNASNTYQDYDFQLSSNYKLAFIYYGKVETFGKAGSLMADAYIPCFNSDNINEYEPNVISCTNNLYNRNFSITSVLNPTYSFDFYSDSYLSKIYDSLDDNIYYLYSSWKPLETDIPIFSTLSQVQKYFDTGDTSGQINKDISNFHDFSQDVYTEDIPVPELSKLCFTGFDINNNTNDIYNVDLIIQSNYYGVSYQKKGMVYVYAVDYDWIYKTHYYNISDSKSNQVKKSQINVLGDFGVDIFSDYVSDYISWGLDYPNITNLRNYSFIWYNSAASQTYYNTRHVQKDLIDETTLKITGQPEVIYYVRFYDDSGNYGRWARYLYRADDVKLQSVVNVGQLDVGEDGRYIIDDNGNPSTSQTITTNQNFITNETEDNRLDFDITSATNFFDYIKSIFDSIISSLNSFGNLIKACLGFLPDDLLNAIFAGIVIMLFVGVVKVVRG